MRRSRRDGFWTQRGSPRRTPGSSTREVALLTFGQWKGYALNLLMEATGGALTGAGVLESFTGLNGVLVQAINIEFFTDVEEFKRKVDSMIEQVRSSQPSEGVEEVMLPGDPETLEMAKRMKDGIPIEEKTWEQIVEVAKKLGVGVPTLELELRCRRASRA